MKMITLLILALIVVAFFIVATYNLDLKDADNRSTFARVYTGYIIKVAGNIKQLAQNTFKQDWKINNSSNKTGK